VRRSRGGTTTSTPGQHRARRRRAVQAPEVAEVAESVIARLPDLVVERIEAEIEFFRKRDVVSREDLHESVGGNLASMARQLTADRPPDLSAPRATGRRRAEQGTPLADILHAYRIGFAELWEAILDQARRGACRPAQIPERIAVPRAIAHVAPSLHAAVQQPSAWRRR
jgi:hypothetical protein